MSTPNFCNDEYFDLYVADDELAEFITESSLNRAIEYAEKKTGRKLGFFEIELLGGHYSGCQLKVNEDYYCRTYGNPIDRDNEGCKYQWDLCRSRAVKKYESEKRFLNKKFLPAVADYLGFRKLLCVGMFSNGEALYQWA